MACSIDNRSEKGGGAWNGVGIRNPGVAPIFSRISYSWRSTLTTSVQVMWRLHGAEGLATLLHIQRADVVKDVLVIPQVSSWIFLIQCPP